MPLEQVADIFMCEWQAPVVVLLEELQIVLTRPISLPALVYHSIEYY